MTSRNAVLALGLFAAALLAGCSTYSVTTTGAAAAVPEATDIHDVPRLRGVVADGADEDWGDQGLRVELLVPGGPMTKSPDDHSSRMRLGWTDQGLIVLLEVRDDVWVEDPKDADPGANDAVDLFLMAEPGASQASCKWVITPGMATGNPEPRWIFHDRRKDPNVPKGPADPVIGRTKTADGYVMEVLLPFSCMGIRPEVGRKLGFQLCVDDADKPAEQSRYRAGWASPAEPERPVIHHKHAIRLAESASAPVAMHAEARYDFTRMQVSVSVVAAPRYAGADATIRAGKGVSSTVRLATDHTGYAVGRAVLPLPSRGQEYGRVGVWLGGKCTASSILPDFAKRRAESVVHSDMRGHPPVFTEVNLPEVEFDRPLHMRGLLGKYELTTTYYDSDYRLVRRADKPGRYGAVVEVRSENYPMFRRFVTLFRSPGRPDWWQFGDLTAHMDLPPGWGISSNAATTHAEAIGEYLLQRGVWAAYETTQTAVLLAGLYETKPRDAGGFYDRPQMRDRQWWVGLKRKLYGWDEQFTQGPPLPRPLAAGEKPAPVVREGKMAQAGMAPDAPERIDAVLKQWEADTDMAFAVCVVRNGVIVLHRAYGQRAGRPMTVETPSKVASVTKLLSATMLMMFVDRGLLDLDKPIATYLPPLQRVKTNRPLTIRHCYTHTCGTDWHWGDHAGDMSERLALVLPEYEIARRYFYNGTGMALACKAMEAVSGQSQPNLFNKCLWQPLGCKRTFTADASGEGATVPLELARLGQLLLNKGAYGDKRFFSEKTFERMLPRNLSYILGEDTHIVYGFATTWYEGDGLGKGTFGHGSATSTTIRIDPENNLVIVMNRNGRGRNFNKYHPKFIQAVTGSLARQPKK